MDRLPPELITHIIEFNTCNEHWRPIDFDWAQGGYEFFTLDETRAKKALLACSAVSRKFRQLTLPSLFHTVALCVDSTSLVVPTVDYFGRPLYSLFTFLMFLDECPVARHAIREIRIAVNPRADGEAQLSDVKLFTTVLHRLPRLRVVGLQNAFFAHCHLLSHHGQPTVSSERPSLERLQLHLDTGICPPYEIRTVFPLLNSFESIRTVRFDSFSFLDDHPHTLPYLTARMTSVQIVNCDQMNILLSVMHRSMAANALLRSLGSLDLCCVYHKDLDDIIKMLSFVGSGLSHMSLCLSVLFDCIYDVPDAMKMAKLFSSCPRLQSLTFKWDVEDISDADTRAGAVLSLLHKCPTLRTVTLELRTVVPVVKYQERLLETIDGAGIFAFLQEPLLELDQLCKITVELLPDHSELGTTRDIQDEPWYAVFTEEFTKLNFPRLREKGNFHLKVLACAKDCI